MAIENSLPEGSLVDGSIGKEKLSQPMSATHIVLSNVPEEASAYRPDLFAVSMLQVFFPLTRVARTVCKVVRPMSMSFAIPPVTLVKIPIRIDESTLAMVDIIRPVAFIARSIVTLLDSATLSFPVDALTRIFIEDVRFEVECLNFRDAVVDA